MAERVAGRSGRGELRDVPDALAVRLPLPDGACGMVPVATKVRRLCELKHDIMRLESARASLDDKIRHLRRLQASIVS
jgi:hypothetical protein